MTGSQRLPDRTVSLRHKPTPCLVEPYNLWEIQGIVADRVEHQILQLVHHPEQILS